MSFEAALATTDVLIIERVSALLVSCAAYQEWRKQGEACRQQARVTLESMRADAEALQAGILSALHEFDMGEVGASSGHRP